MSKVSNCSVVPCQRRMVVVMVKNCGASYQQRERSTSSSSFSAMPKCVRTTPAFGDPLRDSLKDSRRSSSRAGFAGVGRRKQARHRTRVRRGAFMRFVRDAAEVPDVVELAQPQLVSLPDRGPRKNGVSEAPLISLATTDQSACVRVRHGPRGLRGDQQQGRGRRTAVGACAGAGGRGAGCPPYWLAQVKEDAAFTSPEPPYRGHFG